MSEISDAMNTLNAQWYNAICTGVGLSPDQFQLFQGSTGLGNTDDLIFRFFDAIPPVSVANYYNPAQANSLSQAYGGVINNLVPQDSGAMANLLKNNYKSWVDYSKTNLPTPPFPVQANGQIDFVKVRILQFQTWGLTSGIDGNTIQAGTTILEQVDIVSVAIAAWAAATKSGKGYAYTATQTDVTNAVNNGQTKSATLDSQTASSDTQHSWAKVSASGFYEFFSAGASGNWDKFTQDIRSSGVKINVTYQKQATLPGMPYAVTAPNSVSLQNYTPWWNATCLKTAQDNNNNNVWNHTAPTWDQTFGAHGNLKRLSTALVIVDGIQSKMTSSASIAKADQQRFSATVKAGYWPFFSMDGQGGWSHDTSYNDDGSFTITSSCQTGNRNVLGILVTSLDSVIGHS